MKTQAQRVAEIWSDWNERKISGEMAIHKVQKIFPKATLKEWNRRMEEIEAAHSCTPTEKDKEVVKA